MQKFLAALALLGTALGAQAASSDLLGTYAIRDKGQLKEFIKVSQDSGAVVISEKQKNGSWKASKHPLTPVTREQFEKLLKQPYGNAFDGLGNKNVAVFKVPKDFQSGKFRSETGYFLVFALGPVELYKLQ